MMDISSMPARMNSLDSPDGAGEEDADSVCAGDAGSVNTIRFPLKLREEFVSWANACTST